MEWTDTDIWTALAVAVAVLSFLVLSPVIVLRYFKRKYRISEEQAFGMMVNAKKSVFAWAVTETILLVYHFRFNDFDPHQPSLWLPTVLFTCLWLVHGFYHLRKRHRDAGRQIRTGTGGERASLRQSARQFPSLRVA